MTTRSILVLVAALSGGCAPAPDVSSDRAELPAADALARDDVPTTADPLPVTEIEARRVGALLHARHPSDLPGRATLDRHPGAELVLRQLAVGDHALIVRARALDRLGLYSTPASEQ